MTKNKITLPTKQQLKEIHSTFSEIRQGEKSKFWGMWYLFMGVGLGVFGNLLAASVYGTFGSNHWYWILEVLSGIFFLGIMIWGAMRMKKHQDIVKGLTGLEKLITEYVKDQEEKRDEDSR